MEKGILVHDELCEKQVLGVMLQYHEYYAESADILTADAFYNLTNRYIYQSIGEIVGSGGVPDMISLNAYTKQNSQKGIDVDVVYLMEIVEGAKTSVSFTQNCRRLDDLRRRRSFSMIGADLMAAGSSEIADTDDVKSKAISSLQSLDDAPQTSIKSASEAIKELDAIVSGNLKGALSIGVPTGFRYLDEKGGLQPTDLWIIAAEFSQGKTSLALDICINAARNGHPCAFFSTEMMSVQLAARMLAGQSGISSRIIMQQPLDEELLKKYDRAIGKMENLPIYFDDTSTLSVERIISSIRSLVRKRGVKIAFIDYLQVLQTNERNLNRTEEQFFGLAARKFKNLAKELQISIVLISQIARSKETTEPTLSRIRGSGQISEAADVVLLIYRPEYYGKRYGGIHANVSTKGTALVKLAKGRNIGTGEFICGYDAAATHFYELTTIPQDENNKRDYDEEKPF